MQRDLLPIIEGSVVTTKHGNVNTDHILFICSGAFHSCKPSDMLAELQGRLPVRVELKGLTCAVIQSKLNWILIHRSTLISIAFLPMAVQQRGLCGAMHCHPFSLAGASSVANIHTIHDSQLRSMSVCSVYAISNRM